MNKNNLLVTLADKNYIKQAKQLFSSVYHNTGWKGDYMLLSHQIPEKGLSWFKDKGILIKRCQPLPCLKDWQNKEYPSCVFDKFYLFQKEFKKWDKIVFLDADIIVRASLEKLTEVKGLSSVCIKNKKLKSFFKNLNKKEASLLKKRYNLNKPAFNSGVMAFNTNIIRKDSFNKLIDLFKKYKNFCTGDDSLINLLFYKKWSKLPQVYNISPEFLKNCLEIKSEKIKGIILHFPKEGRFMKSWHKESLFCKEWKKNLDKADLIDFKKITSGKKWSRKQIRNYCWYLKFKEIIWLPKRLFWNLFQGLDRQIGKLGILLRNKYPNFYFKIKFLKQKIFIRISSKIYKNEKISQPIISPILIFQYGKVGSTSILQTLQELNLETPVYHAHFLTDFKNIEKKAKKDWQNPTPFLKLSEKYKIIRKKIDSSTIKWKIISGIRDPIEAKISGFFENLRLLLKNYQEIINSQNCTDKIIQEFNKQINKNPKKELSWRLNWFDPQMKAVFGIDVYKTPFNKEKGYKIYNKEKGDLLLIRQENLSSAWKEAIESFLGIKNCKLKKINVSQNKKYGHIYQEFKKRIKIPSKIIKLAYNSKVATHFYTKKEIKKFKKKWSKSKKRT